MSRPGLHGGGLAVPRPSKTIIALLVANVVAYVLELVLLRLGQERFVTALFLTPEDVYGRGFVWQLFTYGWFHDPSGISHLLFNMLWLWIFGSQMEAWWGRRRFLKAYAIFILAGGLLTVLVGLLADLSVFGGLLEGFESSVHLGASGATLGVTVAWGLTHAERVLSFFLLGQMRGKTFVLLIVGLQLLVALSFQPTSTTAHFGGILGAFVLCRGLWRPSRWREIYRRQKLRLRKSAIQRQLDQLKKKDRPEGWRVIDGGNPPDDDPKKWN
jgi:membrane associated rhomboid family serine protease